MEENRGWEDDFDSYEDFESYFIHCINTINQYLGTKYPKKEIAYRLGFTSPSALSLRLNSVDMGNLPRLNLKHLWLYLNVFKDFRPVNFLLHHQRKVSQNDEDRLVDELAKLGKEINRIQNKLREKYKA